MARLAVWRDVVPWVVSSRVRMADWRVEVWAVRRVVRVAVVDFSGWVKVALEWDCEWCAGLGL